MLCSQCLHPFLQHMILSQRFPPLASSLALALCLACSGSTEPGQAAYEIIFRGQLGNSDGGFIVMNADGSARRVLARPSDGFFCPSLSPDGNRLLYATATTNRLAVLDLRSGAESQLTQGTLWSQCPAWSPDGRRIAFFRGPSTAPNGFGLYVMNADGSNVRELASDGYVWNGIDWSPDGRWLAVTRMDFKLVLVDAVTGSVGRVLTPSSIGYQADFSPDGARVAYNVESNGSIDIYLSNTDGTNARRLTASSGSSDSYMAPRWSPDGALLAYWAFVPDTLPGRRVPGVLLISSDGDPIAWQHGGTVYGDQPFWRRAP